MKLFVKMAGCSVRNKNQRGVTLIELLVTITLSSLALSLIYGVFITGIKLYQKIGIEGQLRDEGDYYLTTILNTLYTTAPDYISTCPQKTNCIEFSNTIGMGIQDYSGKNIYIPEPRQMDSLNKTQIRLEDGKLYVAEVLPDGKTQNEATINNNQTVLGPDSFILINGLVNDSQSGTQEYKSAIITLHLSLQNKHYQETGDLRIAPVILESKFAF